VAKKVAGVRKSSLTFAPEAGTQRLRDVINKCVSEDDLMRAARAAFGAGWRGIKLYFMLGLPTESMEDVRGIADLAHKVLSIARETAGRGGSVTVSASSFVPKPWTPFQWEAQDGEEILREKQLYLKSLFKSRAISYQYHDTATSALEGAFARGDRRLSAVLYRAWQLGARFDGWSECFRRDIWQEAFAACGLDMDFYTVRARAEDEVFPWEHLSPGVTRAYLWRERERALRGETTPDCRAGCTGCGVCPALGVTTLEATR
jgi:radical SAM superfamily enzyme YgiQ (UPF0313 family)